MDARENQEQEKKEINSKEKRPLFYQEPRSRKMRVTRPAAH